MRSKIRVGPGSSCSNALTPDKGVPSLNWDDSRNCLGHDWHSLGLEPSVNAPGSPEAWFVESVSAAGVLPSVVGGLELLERAHGHLPGANWLVGRTTAQSLARRRLIFVRDELVFLTDAGREALARERELG